MAVGCWGNGIHLLSSYGMKTQSVFIHDPNFYLSIWILSREEVGSGLKFFFQFSGSIGSASRSDCRVTRRRKVIYFKYSHPRRPSILCPVPGSQPICNQTTIPQSSIWCFVLKHLPQYRPRCTSVNHDCEAEIQDAVEIPPSCHLWRVDKSRFSYNLLLEIPPKPSKLLPTTKFFANDPVPLAALQDGKGKTVLRYLSGRRSP